MTQKQALQAEYVGRSLDGVPVPAVVLDLAKLEANCGRMLDTCEKLGVLWRAHIKTHKTIELTRLQVGDDPQTPANIIVSTVLEAENILPLLKEYQGNGRKVNVLYSFPLHAASVDRLAAISKELGPDGLSVMIDHPDQFNYLLDLSAKAGNPPLVFLKIDMGYHRAGVEWTSETCKQLWATLLEHEAAKNCVFHGLYCHGGHAYDARESSTAYDVLVAEIRSLKAVADAIRAASPGHHLVLSVGSTPTATWLKVPGPNSDGTPEIGIEEDLVAWKKDGTPLEVHAGVYPTLDVQQLATRNNPDVSSSDIAITVLVEVASLYPGRGPGGTTEALITAGSLAIGREPVKDMGNEKGVHYAAWGIVMPWKLDNPTPTGDFPAVHTGWQIGRISQEHGILTWQGSKEVEVPLRIGQKLRIWPNHACIAGAGHEWYLIVDSRREGKEDEIVDVWPRWKGW